MLDNHILVRKINFISKNSFSNEICSSLKMGEFKKLLVDDFWRKFKTFNDKIEFRHCMCTKIKFCH